MLNRNNANNQWTRLTPMVLKWATEFRQPSVIDAGRQLYDRLPDATKHLQSMRNFTLSCFPCIPSEDIKKNT